MWSQIELYKNSKAEISGFEGRVGVDCVVISFRSWSEVRAQKNLPELSAPSSVCDDESRILLIQIVIQILPVLYYLSSPESESMWKNQAMEEGV